MVKKQVTTPPSPTTQKEVANMMDCRVDWLAYTVPIRIMPDGGGDLNISHILSSAALYQAGVADISSHAHSFECGASHGFYAFSAWSPALSLTVQWGGVNPHAYFQWTGMGCEWLRKTDNLYDIIVAVQDRVTRIDFATDIVTKTTPKEFVARCQSERFKSRTSIQTPTGDTEYVGSRTSQQMARVYRYHKPHPRAKFLRVEVELKQDKAKAAAKQLTMVGLKETCQAANASFQWGHPDWDVPSLQVARIPSKKHDKSHAATLRWLENAVVPALKALEREEVLDIKEWFESRFL